MLHEDGKDQHIFYFIQQWMIDNLLLVQRFAKWTKFEGSLELSFFFTFWWKERFFVESIAKSNLEEITKVDEILKEQRRVLWKTAWDKTETNVSNEK